MNNYVGCVFVVSCFVLIESFFIFYFYNKIGYVDKLYLYSTPILVVTAWCFGKHLDNLASYTKKIKENEDKLVQTQDSLKAVIWSYDVVNKVATATAGIEKLFGYKLESYDTDPMIWKNRVHPDDLEVVLKHEKELFGGQEQEIEYRILRENNRIIWIKCISSLMLDTEKK